MGSNLEVSNQVSNAASSVQTRSIATLGERYPERLETSISDEFKMSIAPWINRPFFVGNVAWTTTATRYSNISTPVVTLPRDIFNSNPSLTRLMQLASMYRCKLCLNISITGTITHQGMLLAAILPPSTTDYSTGPLAINSMLTGPHAFLAANEASSVCLEVPWYNNSELGLLDSAKYTAGPYTSNPDIVVPNANCATLLIKVINPLATSTGSSTSVNIVIEAFFKELDLFVATPKEVTFSATAPTSSALEGEGLWQTASKATDKIFEVGKQTTNDAIDLLRGTFKYYTGLHNPNNARLENKNIVSTRNYLNVVDSGTCIEKLDPESTLDRITTEPIFDSDKDEMLIKSIVSKPQYLGTFSVQTTWTSGRLLWARPISPYQGGCLAGRAVCNNIELLHRMTRAHKGGLKIFIQSSMTNKQSVKLKVIKYYNPAPNIYSNYPTMASLYSAPSDLLEFSAGNQMAEVKLPFLCRNKLMYNTRDKNAEALQLGMYYIYLAQPMAVGDSSPTTIEFNVYMACDDDFQYYGYSKEVGSADLGFTLPAANDPPLKGESSEVMNRPTDQKMLLSHSEKENMLDSSRLNPLIDIRPLIRRFQFAFRQVYTDVGGIQSIRIPLSALYGEYQDGIVRGSNGLLPYMYYGKNFGLKFKMKVQKAKLTNINFVAPNYCTDRTTVTSSVAPGLYRSVPKPIGTTNFCDASPFSYPLPGVEWPVSVHPIGPENEPVSEYEFTIPNTSVYKYIGGPEKFLAVNTVKPEPQLASADFGSLVFSFETTEPVSYNVTLYYGFTDESRFGFHAMAPTVYYQYKNIGTPPVAYLETPDEDIGGPIPLANRATIYYSNLSTSFS